MVRLLPPPFFTPTRAATRRSRHDYGRRDAILSPPFARHAILSAAADTHALFYAAALPLSA